MDNGKALNAQPSDDKNYDLPRDSGDKKKPAPSSAKVQQLEGEVSSLQKLLDMYT